MNSLTEEKKDFVNKEAMKKGQIDIKGKWRLTYKVSNSMGAAAFGSQTIPPYRGANGKVVYPLNVEGDPIGFLFIEQIVTDFNPDAPGAAGIKARYDIEWLLNHPEIKIQGLTIPEQLLQFKKNNTPWTLISLDHQEMNEVEEEDFIDKLIGKLSLDSGTNAVSLKNIRYIMAELNLQYRDIRGVSSAKVEKNLLRAVLKRYVRAKLENAKQVYKILDNLDSAENTFNIKEMIRFKIIVEGPGYYKYKETSIGVSLAGILAYWEKYPDIKVSMVKELESKISEEEDSFK